MVFAMTSAFYWQNPVSLWTALFCAPWPNLPVIPGISWLATFSFQSSIMKRTSFWGVNSEMSCRSSQNHSSPGSGRSAGEGIGYPLQYSWASLVAQLVKNLPAVWETWVQSLGWKDPLEKGMATHSSFLAWRIPLTSPWGHKELDTTERLSLWY